MIVCSQCKTPYEFAYTPEGKLPEGFPFCSSRCQYQDLAGYLDPKGGKSIAMEAEDA